MVAGGVEVGFGGGLVGQSILKRVVAILVNLSPPCSDFTFFCLLRSFCMVAVRYEYIPKKISPLGPLRVHFHPRE